MENGNKHLQTFCRCCLKEDKSMISLFANDDVMNREPRDIISQISGLTVIPTDELPSLICTSCIEGLRSIHTFITEVLKSHTILVEHLEKTNFSTFKVMTTLPEILTQKLYDCSMCGTKFITEFNLIRHQRVCAKSLTQPLVINENSVEKVEIILCKQPSFPKKARRRNSTKKSRTQSLKQEKQLGRIKRSLENPKGIYICDHCDVDFRYLQSLKDHLKLVETLGKFTCVYCGGKEYRNKETLVSHIHYDHDSKRPYKCLECECGFTKWEALQMHVRQRHTKEKVLCCPKCPKKFILHKDLNRHVISHETKFICSVCGKAFKYSFTLNMHKQTHLANNEKICSECGKSFCGDFQLRRHVRVAHTGESHQCSVCEKTFTHITRLRRHQLSHTPVEEWPLKCQFCTKRFILKHHLIAHENIHNMVRPFLCCHCGKGFVQKIQLQVHLKQHNL